MEIELANFSSSYSSFIKRTLNERDDLFGSDLIEKIVFELNESISEFDGEMAQQILY